MQTSNLDSWKVHSTVKPPVKDTPKEDKPPNKGQAKSTLVPLKEDNLSTKDKMAGLKVSLLRGSTCIHLTQFISAKISKSNWYSLACYSRDQLFKVSQNSYRREVGSPCVSDIGRCVVSCVACEEQSIPRLQYHRHNLVQTDRSYLRHKQT